MEKQSFLESARFKAFIIAIVVSIFARATTWIGWDIPVEIAAGVSNSIGILAVALIVALSYRNTDPEGVKEPFFESQRVRLALVIFAANLIFLFLPMVAPEIPVDIVVETLYMITGLSSAYIGGRSLRNTEYKDA